MMSVVFETRPEGEMPKLSPFKLETLQENGMDLKSHEKDNVASKVLKLEENANTIQENVRIEESASTDNKSKGIKLIIKKSAYQGSSKENSPTEVSPPKQETPTKVRELCKALKDDFRLVNSALSPVTEDVKGMGDSEVTVRNANDVLMEAKSPPPKSSRKGQAKRQRGRKKVKVEGTTTSLVKAEKGGAKAKKPADQTNHLLTDFYPIRRSARVPASQLKKMEQQKVEEAVLANCIDGLKVEVFPMKGRGVVAEKTFKKGDFVVEYSGDLIDLDTAKQRDKDYTGKSDVGCYMYYFNHKNKAYCIDATAESGKLGRLLNHSKTNPNCGTKVVDIENRPYLIIIAVKDISVGEELLYDYGDRNKETLAANPWLAY